MANTSPIFPLTPNIPITTPLTTANTAKDGTGTVVTLFTAGASGSFIEDIRILAKGTNVASVFRVFLNNGGANSTAANNALWYEVTLAATTLSEVAALNPVIITINKAIPAGYTLIATIGTTIAAGVMATCTGGDY